MDRVYSPATLAREWECSERHIRNLIVSGELRGFRLGKKLLRIPLAAVEEFLCRKDTRSDACAETSLSSFATAQGSGTVIRSEPLTRARLNGLRQRSMQS